MRKSLYALAVVALATIAVGCGDSDDSSSLSKAQFVKKGNAICTKGNEDINKGFEKFSREHKLSEQNQPNQAELAEAAEEILLPRVTEQIEALRGLGAPEGDEAKVEKILGAAEKAVEEAEEDPRSLRGSNTPFSKPNKLAREYGLTVCGEE
jgi:hypothetical protein